MQFPISQAMVHCDGKWELHEERRVRYNSPSLPSLVEGFRTIQGTWEMVHAQFIKKKKKKKKKKGFEMLG